MELIFTCVCSNCSHHEKEKVILEFNFFDNSIYWRCPSCDKVNKMELAKPSIKLPKINIRR